MACRATVGPCRQGTTQGSCSAVVRRKRHDAEEAVRGSRVPRGLGEGAARRGGDRHGSFSPRAHAAVAGASSSWSHRRDWRLESWRCLEAEAGWGWRREAAAWGLAALGSWAEPLRRRGMESHVGGMEIRPLGKKNRRKNGVACSSAACKSATVRGCVSS